MKRIAVLRVPEDMKGSKKIKRGRFEFGGLRKYALRLGIYAGIAGLAAGVYGAGQSRDGGIRLVEQSPTEDVSAYSTSWTGGRASDVPEPTTLGLMLAGGAALLRRKR